MGKILLWSSALLLVALVLFLLFFDALAQGRLTAHSGQIPGTLKVEKFFVTSAGLGMRGVEWKFLNPEPLFKAKEVNLDLKFVPALRGEFMQALQGVKLDGPGLRVVVDRNGELNLTRLFSGSQESEGLDFSQLRAEIELVNGWLLYKDRRDGSFLFELKDWEGQFDFPDGERLEFASSARESHDSTSLLSLEGELSLSEPSLGLECKIQELGLLHLAGFPGFGPGQTQLEGEVSASVLVQGEAETWGELPGEVFVVGDLQLKDGMLRTPWMPAALQNLEGDVRLMGDSVSTRAFSGEVLGIGFRARGRGELGPEGNVVLDVETGRFPLHKLKPLVAAMPDEVSGELEVDFHLEGALPEPTLSGRVAAHDVQASGQQLSFAQSNFLKTDTMLHLSEITAQTSAGDVSGDGWVFLGSEPRVLFDLVGKNARPNVLLPGLAERADFHVKLMGSLDKPLLYGQGDLSGLGEWGRGLSSAGGNFLLSGDNLFLYDGQASVGGSQVNVPLAAIDLAKRQIDGFVKTANFSLADVPGLSGVAGSVTGKALLNADLMDEPKVRAHGRLQNGDFSSGGVRVEGANGDLFFDGQQLVVPALAANFEGSRVNISGLYDTRNEAVAVSAKASSVNLARFGLGRHATDLVGTISGHLGGELGLYGHASSAAGQGAVSAYRTGDGRIKGVAWLDGKGLAPDDPEVSATVVASGTAQSLELDYNGQLAATALDHLGPINIFGEASLSQGILHMRPTLLTARDAVADAVAYPMTTYSGSALPIFGPLLSGPLQKVVIEEPPYPRTRAMTVAGDANLNSGKLDLSFQLRAAGLEEFANLPLSSDIADTSAQTLNDILPYEVLSAYGKVSGKVKGTLDSPVLEAGLHLPWLLLSNDSDQRQGMSVKGQFALGERLLRLPALLASEIPFDPRLARPQSQQLGHGLLDLSGRLQNSGLFDLRLDTVDFGADVLAFFAHKELRSFFPYGRVATDNLHLWGRVEEPSVSGSVSLTTGGVRISGEAFPLETARLDFSSQGRAVRVEELLVQAPGLLVKGFGSRSHGGKLEGEVSAHGVDFEKFHRLGGVVTGFTGQADLVARVEGQYPESPRLELGLKTAGLTWNPGVTGGLEKLVSVEELALGHFSADGSLEKGALITKSAQGLSLQLPPDGFRLRTEGGLSLVAEGGVQAGSNSSSSLLEYLASPTGPDFGEPGAPFRVKARNWTFKEASRLLGSTAPEYNANASVTVELEGQWWRDHAKDAQEAKPRYALDIEQLSLEGGEADQRTGFKLSRPSQIVYQRKGEAGFLDVRDFHLGFFRHEPAPTEVPEGEAAPTAEDLVFRQGNLDLEAHLALTQLPQGKPQSSLSLAAVDLPLENLSFLLPKALGFGGVVDSLEVNLHGVLPSPQIAVEGLATNLALGPVQGMTLRGGLQGRKADGETEYEVSLASSDGKPVTLTFGDNEAATNQVTAQGGAKILWRKDPTAEEDRLRLVGRNLELSPESPLAMSASVVDRNLDVLADIVPDKEVTSGTLAAELKVEGTLRRPEFSGKATLADGRFNSKLYGDFAGLQLDATVERLERKDAEDSDVLRAASSGLITRFQVHQFEGTLGGQPFFAGGKAELAGIAPTFLKLFFVGESLPLKLPDLFSGRADVEVVLKGKLKENKQGPYLVPQLLGTIVLPAGELDVPLGAVSKAEGNSSMGLPGEVEVDVTLGREFYVNALDSSIRATGDLKLVTEGGNPKLYGQTQLSRGQIRIPFYDASFRVRNGVAHFDGPLMPRLEAVEAVADLGGYRIVAQADGRLPDDLHINLISDPPLPQSELSRLVVLGGLPGQTSSANGGDPTQSTSQGSLGVLSGQGVSFLSGILTNRLTEKIGRLFFLSEISFDYVPPAQYVIKLAKALDEQDTFLLTMTRIIRNNGLNENLFGVEWRFVRNLLVRGAFDEFARPRFWFQSINRF